MSWRAILIKTGVHKQVKFHPVDGMTRIKVFVANPSQPRRQWLNRSTQYPQDVQAEAQIYTDVNQFGENMRKVVRVMAASRTWVTDSKSDNGESPDSEETVSC